MARPSQRTASPLAKVASIRQLEARGEDIRGHDMLALLPRGQVFRLYIICRLGFFRQVKPASLPPD